MSSTLINIKNLLTGAFTPAEEVTGDEKHGKQPYVHTTEGEVMVDVDNYEESVKSGGVGGDSVRAISEVEECDEEEQKVPKGEEEEQEAEKGEEVELTEPADKDDPVNTTVDTVKSIEAPDAAASPTSAKSPEKGEEVQEVSQPDDTLRKIAFGSGYLGALIIFVVLVAALTSRNRKDDEKLVPGMMCADAEVIESFDGPVIFEDSTLKETDPGELSDFSFCGMASPTGPGKWYKFVGDGNVYMASTCFATTDFDTQISIFAGSCESLSCVGANDNYCGDRSQITWFAEAGMEYFVYVHGFRSQVGTFELLIEPVGAMNNECEVPREILGSHPIYGSTQTLGGTENFNQTLSVESNLTIVDEDSSNLSCIADVTSPGLWYTWTGTGRSVAFSTCNSATDYEGAFLSVFTLSSINATCEESLVCIEDVTMSDECDGFGHTVQFVSTPMVEYYILVHGVDGGSQGGNFELSIKKSSYANRGFETCGGSKELFPESDSVPEVEVLRPDTLHDGEAIFSTFNGTCGDSDLTASSPSVWYKVMGTGKTMTASTCDPITAFDTQLTILSGTCDELQCVTGNDQATCGDKASASWETSEDETYYVVVHGYGARWGAFALHLEEDRLESS